jgi:predicted nucleic acid-binding protein
MSEVLLADAGYWFGLFDARDQHHNDIVKTADLFDASPLVVPWPSLYETLRTRFVRRQAWVLRLDERLRRPNVEFIEDRWPREVYERVVEYSTRERRSISMVDMYCRLLIEDPGIRIDYFLTTNPGDFYDVCAQNRVELVHFDRAR